jgi:hypothetical protein
MNLAKNEEKIRAAIREREGKNDKKDTVSFLTLRARGSMTRRFG